MPIDPQAVIAEARIEAAAKDRRSTIEFEKEHRRLERLKSQFVASCLRPANVEDYSEWLRGYIMNGGELGSVFNHPFLVNEVYFAVKDFKDMPCLHGAQSIEIIVPVGLNGPSVDDPMSIGHSTIYFMEGYRIIGHRLPPVYSDIKF